MPFSSALLRFFVALAVTLALSGCMTERAIVGSLGVPGTFRHDNVKLKPGDVISVQTLPRRSLPKWVQVYTLDKRGFTTTDGDRIEFNEIWDLSREGRRLKPGAEGALLLGCTVVLLCRP